MSSEDTGHVAVVRAADAGALASPLGKYVAAASAAAIAESGRFTVAVSGGSLPKTLAAGLADVARGVDGTTAPDFSKWHVFYADERCVALDHADSNHRACKELWFDQVSPTQRELLANCVCAVCVSNGWACGPELPLGLCVASACR